jgi:hypothetical protein
MAATTLTEEDEGKRVVTDDGDEIGVVAEVEGGRAHVQPDPGMLDSLSAKLGWGDANEDTYPIENDKIRAVTDDEIRLDRL